MEQLIPLAAVHEFGIDWMQRSNREGPVFAVVEASKPPQFIELRKGDEFLIPAFDGKRLEREHLQAHLRQEPSHQSVARHLSSFVDRPRRNATSLVCDLHPETKLPEHGRCQKRTFDLPGEVAVAPIAHRSRGQDVVSIPHGLGDDVLHGHAMAGIGLAEDAAHAVPVHASPGGTWRLKACTSPP